MSELRKVDKEKMELEKSKNELEAFIFDYQDKIHQEPYDQCVTAEEKEKISTLLSEASDWLYDQSEGTKKSVSILYLTN